jgi:hypothetical protein
VCVFQLLLTLPTLSQTAVCVTIGSVGMTKTTKNEVYFIKIANFLRNFAKWTNTVAN